ncbi:MAG: hypothetical protein H7Y15_17555, partial [Pseudonocardia sp.]|nr:hypothetical protein [Pseudonocardia sp.]
MTVSQQARMAAQNVVLRWMAARGDELAQLATGRVADPFAVHERIRARGPVVRSRMGLWVVPGQGDNGRG